MNNHIQKDNLSHKNVSDDYKPTPLIYAVQKNDLEMVKLLIESGVDIDAKDSNGNTVFQVAVIMGNIEIIKYLTHKEFEKYLHSKSKDNKNNNQDTIEKQYKDIPKNYKEHIINPEDNDDEICDDYVDEKRLLDKSTFIKLLEFCKQSNISFNIIQRYNYDYEEYDNILIVENDKVFSVIYNYATSINPNYLVDVWVHTKESASIMKLIDWWNC